MGIFRKFSIDLGTANTLIYDLELGMVLQEPTVIALDNETERVIALGNEAEELRGRISEKVTITRPLKDGVIYSQNAAEMMISHFVSQVLGKWNIFLPRVIVAVPSGATDLEKRALKQAINNTRAKLVYLIDEPVAAAIGADLPINEAVGSMILDIGGGTSEVAVLSMAGPIFSESVKVAGNELTESIQQYIKQNYQMVIGFRMAEKLKHQIGSVHPGTEVVESAMEVSGINIVSGLPTKLTIKNTELSEILGEKIEVILGMLRQAFERLQPELATDLAEHGLTLVGGGALLGGLAQLIRETFHIQVKVPSEPLLCVTMGAAKAMLNPEQYRCFLQKVG